ncbi:hypothetical protein FA15DRAFT_668160 [Coprinopsis marcescibilis]|uniref:Uncharacterized protein n=1 Tax=Coprinopsis marcescibilis TaxID=230819 RepID=A0A5C3KYZ9_COPMA|nr:hypothetical protein FA15DRAFT_668160 [Coprinopsis marcescibilis]
MFASRPIPPGTLIKLKHPIFILPALPLEDSSSYKSYERLVQGITESTYAEMETMENCRSKDECPSTVEGVARTNALTTFPPALNLTHTSRNRTEKHYGGEEITKNYTDLLQPRTTRLINLEGDYKFTCDYKWSFLGTYVNTHPSYRKWSMDLCLPDTFVIESHLAVIPLIEKEGLDAL